MPENYDTITSASNPVVKLFRGLERKKGRQETGLFLAEGVRLVSEGLEQGWTLDTLVVGTTAMDRDYVVTLAQTAAASGTRVVNAAPNLMERLARKDNPQAVIGAFRQAHLSLERLTEDGPARFLVLYEIRDPGNLGTLIRTADCAGMDGVLLLGPSCDPYSVEAVRASMGSIFDLPPVAVPAEAGLEWLKRTTTIIVAATMNGEARHDDDVYGERSAVLMGTEQSGLPDTVEAECDVCVRIPMRGGADSLNLAQAGAIMIYEAWRQQGFI